MKILSLLFFTLFWITPLHAETVSVLTELEQVQEKLWYLQSSVAEHQSALETQQQQMTVLTGDIEERRTEMNERLAVLAREITEQQEQSLWMEEALQRLGESLAALADETSQQNEILLGQAEKVARLEESLDIMQAELKAQQAASVRALADYDRRFKEIQAQLDTLGQDMGGRVKQIGYWGGATILFLFAALTIGFFVRKSRESPI